MSSKLQSVESWKRMVLRSGKMPAWLGVDAPYHDVALSSRARYMRNLAGLPLPNEANSAQLAEIMERVIDAVKSERIALHVQKNLTNAERDHLVSMRLVSPDFPWLELGRALMLDESQTVSVMVNEEDHLRIQALTAGWSIDNADHAARACLDRFDAKLEFARDDKGYVASSPANSGNGKRLSVMFHLIGLAQVGELQEVLTALLNLNIDARGVFGEASRAIGAYFQVSVVKPSREEFVGACEYLVRKEREARQSVDRSTVEEKAEEAARFVEGSPKLSLSDCLRVLAWIRWAACADIGRFAGKTRMVDSWLTLLEVRTISEVNEQSRLRADFLRKCLGSMSNQ